MQLYFIRHGQSENNALWDQIGSGDGRSHDPALTETGRRQAQALGAALRDAGPGFAPDGKDPQNQAGFGLTHIYCSLMLRAVQTGALIAQALGLPLTAWPDLHEGGGIYLHDEQTGEPVGLPGSPRSFFQANYPQLILPGWLDESGWWNRPFEDRPQRRERARRFLSELALRHGESNDRVAVVSHGGFYNHVLAVLLKPTEVIRPPSKEAVEALAQDNVILTEQREVWFTINNAAITRIDFTIEETKLVYLNRLDFMPRELIT